MTTCPATRCQSPGHQYLHLRQFALAAFFGAVAASAGLAAEAPSWERLPRLVDVGLRDARDVTTALRTGPVEIALPWTTTAAGATIDSLVVGDGWVELHRAGSPPALLLPGTDGKQPAPLRFDVLSGESVRLGPEGMARVLVAPDGVAIRWAGLTTPRGLAHAELLVSRTGDVTVQYLRVPQGLDGALRAGQLHAGAPELPLSPSSATAYRLPRVEGPVLRPPGTGSVPQASGPPPAGCVPETGTWCERADGPGTSRIFIQQDFDGGYDIGGPFFTADLPGRTQMWHLTPYAACPPGAAGTGGQSAYFGSDATCSYQALAGGSLLSPVVGPVTATTQLVWSSRIGFEDLFDPAEIYINGTLIGGMPNTLDPTLWYNFNPISLAPWAGGMVQIEFRFESDASVQDLGWFIDDVIVWDPAGPANADCIRSAGFADYSPCDQRVATQWDFYENAFCQGCEYTFYVIVECGREMHLPLWDMEGGEVTVTNVVTGAPVPLRCINNTALADGGTGSYSGQFAGDINGRALDCCPGGGPETWWGPAFDETDNAGPGSVRWGLDDGCPTQLAYDTSGNGALECSELPPTCGGVLPLVSPGDVQVMDCFLEDNSGLCGLYRVQVTSGGFLWSLFANCDGTNTPQFQIFHDCTEAWTAYNPLPEIAIDSLTTANGCPNLDVSFNIVNLGCIDHPGDVPIRITSNCSPPDVLDTVVLGGIPAGGSVPMVVPFPASCSPVRIEVFADPDDIIVECTESSTVAACRTIPGADSLATFTCGCTAQLIAVAGADVAACVGTRVTLDGSGSSIAPCATPEYRWLDQAGGILRDWDIDPTHQVTVGGCPAGNAYTLEIRCNGEACVEPDVVRVDCVVVTANAGPDVRECVGTSVTLDGSGSGVAGCATPEYRWFDALGFEVRGWGPTPNLNLGPLTCAMAGGYTIEVRCAGDPTCTEVDDVIVACVEVAASAGPDFSVCEDMTFDITWARGIRTGCTDVIYQWFDSAGNPLTAPGPDPNYSNSLTGCPGTLTLVFVAACNDPGFETCGSFDTVDITCPKPLDPIPTATPGCSGTASLDCGVLEPGVVYWWDIDTTVDSDGNTVLDDDRDLPGCAAIASWPVSGTHPVRAWAQELSADCTSFADISADSFDPPAAPIPTAIPGCAGAPSELFCGSSDPSSTFSWDTDIAVDTDGNTIPDDDADAATCDAFWAYPDGGSRTARVTVTDAQGCTNSADVVVDVPTGLPPAEVQDDRVTHGTSSLTFTWSALAGSPTYRISRGDIGAWYSHAADDLAGRGTCATSVGTTWTDVDDAADAGDYYYLITGLDPCGLEGIPGDRWNGTVRSPRDARTPTGSCP